MKKRIALIVLAFAGAAVAASLATGSPQYATTPTSSGPVNPKALPLGDGYVSTTPKVGYVDSCQTTFNGGGAFEAGPWIDQTAKTWDETTKLTVSGSVAWPAASYKETVDGSTRTVVFNDLPDHTTGVFPIASTDPAYQYDRNPNHIAAQTNTWKLPLYPTAAATPQCVGMGAIGVLADGVYLYNALDAGGRDAAAYEVLDACAGHPDQSSSYHHHDIPPCLLSEGKPGESVLVGYALDGYGIYVTEDANGDLPTNTDLDACHGTTSAVPWNGTTQTVYHYVATLEYPYTIGCYHGTPISVKGATGGASGAGSQGGSGGRACQSEGGANGKAGAAANAKTGAKAKKGKKAKRTRNTKRPGAAVGPRQCAPSGAGGQGGAGGHQGPPPRGPGKGNGPGQGGPPQGGPGQGGPPPGGSGGGKP